MRWSQQAVRRRRSVQARLSRAISPGSSRHCVIDALEARRLLSGETVATAISPVLAHTSNPATDSITLSPHFNDDLLPGTLATFETSAGNIQVALTDNATPLTVANFLSYVNSGAYDDTIFHRAAFLSGTGTVSASNPYDIIQGGGYKIEGGSIDHIPTNAPVDDEYTTELYGDVADTLAMAKTSEANSATSEWYFNVKDNSSALDTPTTDSNGATTSYTVFGKVLSGANAIDAIAELPDYDINSTLSTVPVQGISAVDAANGAPITASNLVYTYAITTEPGTTYTAVSDNPALVTPKITNGVLSFTYTSTLSGTANVTVTAKNLDGTSASTVFPVTVPNSATPASGPVTAAITAPFTVTGTTGTFSVLGPDTDSVAPFDPSTVTITTQPTHGSATVNTSTGFISYTPTAGYIGADTLQYTVADTAGTVSSPATVTLSAVNTPVTVTIGTATAKSLTFTQPDGVVGHLSVYKGTAVVTFANYQVTTTTAHGVITANGAGTTISDIVVTNNKQATKLLGASLVLLSNGPVTVGGIQTSALFTDLNMPDVTLTGTVSLFSGRALHLAGLNGANFTIGNGYQTNLQVTNVTNSSVSIFQTAEIQSNQWLITDGGDYTLSSSYINDLNVTGTFNEALDLTKSSGYDMLLAHVGTPTGNWNLGGSVLTTTIGSPGSGWSMEADGLIRSLAVKGSLSNNIVSAAAIAVLTVSGTTANTTIETSGAYSKGSLQIGALKFGGAVSGTYIVSAGNVGSITAPSLSGTRIFAGVDSTVVNNGALPTSTADLASNASIGAITLGRGANAFTDSLIGADILGALHLGDIQISNGGTTEGISAHSINNIVAKLGTGANINLSKAQLKSAAVLSKYITAKKLTLTDFAITLF